MNIVSTPLLLLSKEAFLSYQEISRKKMKDFFKNGGTSKEFESLKERLECLDQLIDAANKNIKENECESTQC